MHVNLFFSLIVMTANVLGSFNDPFEFDGNYGTEADAIRQKVFELVISKEALARNLTDSEIEEAREADRQNGPFLYELATSELIAELSKKQNELQNFPKEDLDRILHFIQKYQDRKVFHFFRNSPSIFLSLDKILRDKATHEGRNFDLPILSSMLILQGQNEKELQSNLLQTLLTEETLNLVKPRETLQAALDALDPDFLKQFLGEEANNQDLSAFCSPGGQVFFYWLYQALNLHLISQEPNLISQVNAVKSTFAQTLGDPKVRAEAFKEKLSLADVGVLCTQESDRYLQDALSRDHLFLPVDMQNSQDGTFVFLRSDLWEPEYKVIAIDGYEGFERGRLNVILATHQSGEKFLLASAHGNSTRAEDGRLQISLIMQHFHTLSQQPENGCLQLLIGIDANTKTEEDVKALRAHLDALGLVATSVGPTTIKKRMVTVQHAKAGRAAVDEEDYLITLKKEQGSHFQFTQQTVGFSSEKPDIKKALPNLDNLSDHYPVGAEL